MTTEQIKSLLRPLAVKWITRGAVWLLTAKLGYDAVTAESEAGAIGNGLATVVVLLVGVLIDRWHHKNDLAEPPK